MKPLVNLRNSLPKYLFLIWGVVSFLHGQNVGIGTAVPNPTARLHVHGGGTQGALLPSVTLNSATTWNPPISTGGSTPGLIVYNTATAGSGVGHVTPGYYYWDGGRWIPMRHLYPVLGVILSPWGTVPATCTCEEGNPNPCFTYLNTYIDLPPGKWVVFIFGSSAAKSNQPIGGTSSLMGRIFLSEDNTCGLPRYYIGDGRIVGLENHGPIGPHYSVITNSGPSTKRYYACGCIYVNYSCVGCGFTEWFVPLMIAFPLAP